MDMSCEDKQTEEEEEMGDSPAEEEIKKDESQEINGLSKNQLRKLKKRERWLLVKKEKRKHERLKKKKRKAEAVEKGLDVGPSRKALKQNSMKQSKCQMKVVIDCSFDSYMSEKDVMKLVKQLQSCYSLNRRAENPLQLYICGCSGKTQERLDNIGDCSRWDVNFSPEKYSELFDKSSLIYLSSESDNVLDDLQEDKVYVIGGLVDHNHYKGLCHRLAVDADISHAQLPISQYLEMKSRKVLTVNHVFEILLQYTKTKDWSKSLFQVIPGRKGVKCLTNESSRDETEADANMKADCDKTDKTPDSESAKDEEPTQMKS
ncbi:tRNA methyltransferase 10 homolog A [Octopus sinensis]|uniref:tRNA (guanine(9)-N(1))-methyltransferase n=1 Tax=Octopus sinensis TaxID=2607531 RepID=A0A6P7SDY2_9MOLL|nr:tRNA methyltransferase 10 homolog A [Octopus sinensis]